MDNPNTRDVTAEMELRELFGAEMRGVFWRGWAELVHQMRSNSEPGSPYHNHHEELWPELETLLNQHARGHALFEGMVLEFDGLLR